LIWKALEHLHHNTLLGLGQATQSLDLLLHLGGGAALGRGCLLTDQRLDTQPKSASQQRQIRDRYTASAAPKGS
jgi:hypothetical protein